MSLTGNFRSLCNRFAAMSLPWVCCLTLTASTTIMKHSTWSCCVVECTLSSQAPAAYNIAAVSGWLSIVYLAFPCSSGRCSLAILYSMVYIDSTEQRTADLRKLKASAKDGAEFRCSNGEVLLRKAWVLLGLVVSHYCDRRDADPCQHLHHNGRQD
eukprot:gnl/TRDRNA2_/TRDRNA2_143363_c2_seq1.p1 gnl/TRDRNA2_/TRDRNA2_143363_c2~~gnl/TRDRNA2_/TRDRNA2_143363_c2_seq1.p1  ORF type:complete len:156 (-),score=3.63 gnl/TRDRNA2_/TRDRNA2_143363_c2_seq1:193-660(-)